MKYKKFIEAKIEDLQLDALNAWLPQRIQGKVKRI